MTNQNIYDICWLWKTSFSKPPMIVSSTDFYSYIWNKKTLIFALKKFAIFT